MSVNIIDTNKLDSNFIYSTNGNATSTSANARRIKDKKVPHYKIHEKNLHLNKTIKHKMSHYFYEDMSYFSIPGLSNTNILGINCDTMVPQGICTCEDYVLITAYDSAHKHNSVIYTLKNNQLIATLIYDKKVHMGGITYDGTYIWIAEGGGSIHGNELGVIPKEDFFQAIDIAKDNNAKSVALNNIFTLQADGLNFTSFCTFYDNLLWSGSFSTNTTSHLYGYSIEKENEQLILKPTKYIEMPKKAQGICFYKDDDNTYLCVSTSYGRRYDSIFRCYKLNDHTKPTKEHNNIKQILKNHAYKTLILPSMAEQINIKDEAIYCIFESGANKYIRNSSRPIGSYCIFDAKKIFK